MVKIEIFKNINRIKGPYIDLSSFCKSGEAN